MGLRQRVVPAVFEIVPNLSKIHFFGTIPNKAFDHVSFCQVRFFAAKALHPKKEQNQIKYIRKDIM
jgi:hypothetical protein